VDVVDGVEAVNDVIFDPGKWVNLLDLFVYHFSEDHSAHR
jgi:hypothetical protein